MAVEAKKVIPAKIGLFGGTLDPIHLGHLRSAEEVREALGLDEVWFIPARLPPHKRDIPLSPFIHRLAMCECATAPVPAFKAVDIEGRRQGPSYTVDTLRELRIRLGADREFFFIMGSDSFLEIEIWKEFRRLTQYADLVIMGREEHDWPEVRDILARAYPGHKERKAGMYSAPGEGSIFLLPVTHLSISGTDIRRRAREGRSVRFLVPREVWRYMEKNKLYTGLGSDAALSADQPGNEASSSTRLAQAIAREILDNKGEDIVILDVRGLSAVTDYFVIAQGRSTRHVQGMADKMRRSLRKRKIRLKGLEGEREGKWILMDFGDVIVHLFYEEIRPFFDLEGLWSQAPRVEAEALKDEKKKISEA